MAAPANCSDASIADLPPAIAKEFPTRTERFLYLRARLERRRTLTAAQGLRLCQLCAWLHGCKVRVAMPLAPGKITSDDMRVVVQHYLPQVDADSTLAFGKAVIGLWVWVAPKPDSDAWHRTRAWVLRRSVVEGVQDTSHMPRHREAMCRADDRIATASAELGAFYGVEQRHRDHALVAAERARAAGLYGLAAKLYVRSAFDTQRIRNFLNNSDIYGDADATAYALYIENPGVAQSLRHASCDEFRAGTTPEDALLMANESNSL